MAITASTIARVRLMTNEPTDSTYSDAAIEERILEHPLPDSAGVAPGGEGWVPTYDLNVLAAEIWNEKAAALASKFSFSADGASFNLNQAYDNAMKMAAYYADQSTKAWKRGQGTRKASSKTIIAYPPPRDAPGYYPNAWVGNLPEDTDW